MKIKVTGGWTTTLSNGREYFSTRLSIPHVDWFRRPGRHPYSLPVASYKDARSTFGYTELEVGSVRRRQGKITINISANPTLTLAHIWARMGRRPDFLDRIANLAPDRFFALTDPCLMLRGLDGGSNFLNHWKALRNRLGQDVFAAFMPIYVEQVQRVCALLLTEYEEMAVEEGNHVLLHQDGRIDLEWSSVSVPQIETYFERYHPSAQSAVRRGAFSLLAADHTARARLYGTSKELGFERDNDCFAITGHLAGTRDLKVYAKTADRIRFEVVRKGKGDNRDLPNTSPSDRLLAIVARERQRACNAVRWEDFGVLLAGPDEAHMGDLGDLIARVVAAFSDDPVRGGKMLTGLLEDGAITANMRDKHAITRLLRNGVIEEVSIRRRNASGKSQRYVLKAPYRDLHLIVAGAIPPRKS